MVREQIVIKNLLISFVKQENAGPQCLLFLHGWRSSKEVWGQIITQLTSPNISFEKERNKTVNIYAIDLPGFGGSQIPSSPMAVGDYAEVVAEFIEKLELKNVVVVGHSFGGRVGIKLASRHQNLIKSLVLVDSAGFAMDSGKKSVMEFIAKIVRPAFRPKFMAGARRKIYKILGADDYVATPELQKSFVNIVSEDLTEDMKKIACPTPIIWGEKDSETPPSFGERMHSIIPNSKFIILPNAGHFSFLDKPEEFVEALSQFLAC